METFLFMAILTMLVIAIISFIVLKKRWQFSIKLFLVGLIGFALPVMMIEGPINALVLSSFGHSFKWFTIIYGGLMAGLVEETTRYLVFKLPSTLVSQVNQLTGFTVLMSLFERLVALVLQVLLTAWDFLAVTKQKLSFYFWAIILHAAIDFLAGAYQLGLVSNLLLIELILAIYVLGIGLLTRRIWRKEGTHGLI